MRPRSDRSSAWLERRVWDAEVAGSNPVGPTNGKPCRMAGLSRWSTRQDSPLRPSRVAPPSLARAGRRGRTPPCGVLPLRGTPSPVQILSVRPEKPSVKAEGVSFLTSAQNGPKQPLCTIPCSIHARPHTAVRPRTGAPPPSGDQCPARRSSWRRSARSGRGLLGPAGRASRCAGCAPSGHPGRCRRSLATSAVRTWPDRGQSHRCTTGCGGCTPGPCG